MKTVLLDNTVLSNFAAIQRSDLLRIALGDQLATSQQAYDELQTGMRLGKLPTLDWSWLSVWTMVEVEQAHYSRFLKKLNAGEAACLALALNRGCRVLTDDRDAREYARNLRIPLSGTLGVLVRLIDTGTLCRSEADTLLEQMIAHGYRSPVVSLKELE